MELRERNYRSRLGSKRSTKAKREGDAEEEESSRPQTDRERFSITNRAERKQVDYTHIVKKWAPLVVLAAIAWWLVSTYLL
jgi:hypothetical protein